MTNYLLNAKKLAGQLAMASRAVDDYDYILSIIGDLGPEYGPFVTSNTKCDTTIRLSELQGMLLSEENRINEALSNCSNISFDVATKPPYNAGNRNIEPSKNTVDEVRYQHNQ